ncbi:MAG TPA: protein kinase [Myxococcales bacterium]|jgi:serine/threonine-protein kinase
MAIHCQTCGSELATWTGKCPHCGGTSQMIIRAPQDPMMGKLIGGKYKITKKLGQGGMGSVYLAENVGIGQRVAIKFLNPSFFGEETIVARFLNEARSYGALTHPNAVQLHEHGQDDDGNLYISMEYVEGQDLKHLLESEKRLSMKDALDIVLQICDVLAYAHGKGIVHRDLKPENVMVVKGMRGWHAKVMDFGVARLADTNRVTAAGSICGTPRYMAPEQAEGREIDHRVDIYALGLVLFESLTGFHPFTAATIAETMRRQVMDPMPHLKDTAPELHLPEALDAAIQKAVAKEPEQRWGSMTDFAKTLVALTPTATIEAISKPPAPAQGQGQTLLRAPPVEKTGHATSPFDRGAAGHKPANAGIYAVLGALAILGGGTGLWFGVLRPPPAPVIEVKVPDVPRPDPLKDPPPPPKEDPVPKPPDPKPETPADPKPADPRPADPKPTPTPNPKPRNPTPLPTPNPKPDPAPTPKPDPSAAVDAIKETRFASDLASGQKAFDRGELSEAASYLSGIPETSERGAAASEMKGRIQSVRTLLEKARAAEGRGDCQGAIGLWDEALRLNGNLKDAHAGRAKCSKAMAPVGLE